MFETRNQEKKITALAFSAIVIYDMIAGADTAFQRG